MCIYVKVIAFSFWIWVLHQPEKWNKFPPKKDIKYSTERKKKVPICHVAPITTEWCIADYNFFLIVSFWDAMGIGDTMMNQFLHIVWLIQQT